jgi:hypothetical protein
MLGHHCKLLWPIDRPSSLSSILLKAHVHDVYPSENLPPETKSPPPICVQCLMLTGSIRLKRWVQISNGSLSKGHGGGEKKRRSVLAVDSQLPLTNGFRISLISWQDAASIAW